MRATKSLLPLLLLPLLLLVFGAASSAFHPSTPTQTSEHYKNEGRIRLEPDVPEHAFGRARHFVREGRVTPTDMLRLQIVLRHDPAAVALLEGTLLAVSDPRNTRYGQYLSINDITDMVGPDPSHAEAVRAFLLANGVPPVHIEVNKNRDIITVRLPAMLAEDMFETMLYRFRHTAKVEASFIRAINSYSLPASIAPLVAFVSELIRFPAIRDLPFVPVPHAATASSFSSGSKSNDSPSDAAFQACGHECAGYITPQVLSERYNLPASLADPCASNNSIALAEFQFQYYDRRDLFIFANTCGVDSVSVEKNYAHNAAIVCTRGGGCIESLLDIEWANVAAGGGAIPLSVYYSMQYSILDWVTAVNDNDDAELVHSVSYGNDELQQTSTEYMLSVNTEFMKAGARGISIFIASGDQGVYGREGPGNSIFHPDFPASSPWVTSVGGTDFVTPSVVGEEMAWEGSGGGFSNTFGTASWQAAAVAQYKMIAAETLPPSFMWNATGRGYPDLSCLGGSGNAYCVSAEVGSLAGVWGTSASTPVVAGMFAQLNNVRLHAGLPPMGFVNPFIYQNMDCFFDVVKGVNDGGFNFGFTAVEGWDPATGVGTPDYAKLEERVLRV